MSAAGIRDTAMLARSSPSNWSQSSFGFPANRFSETWRGCGGAAILLLQIFVENAGFFCYLRADFTGSAFGVISSCGCGGLCECEESSWDFE